VSRIAIYVFRHLFEPLADLDAPRCVTWRGEVDWPSAPVKGDIWYHCGDWAGETVERVGFCGPEDGKTHVSVEVRTDAGVLAHLIAEHGFTE
jgi:hypothetical protein